MNARAKFAGGSTSSTSPAALSGKPPRRKARGVPENVDLRPREPRDSGDLFSLFNEPGFLENALMRDAFASVEELDGWLNGIMASKRIETAAIREDRCIGFGAVFGLRDHFEHCGSLILGVRQSCRNRGVGGLLLAQLLQTAKGAYGLRKVQLTVLSENVEAIKLYRRHGFRFEGLHRRFVRRQNGFVDAYSMAVLFE